MKIEDSNKNEECDVESLQKMCELTGGKIRIVDPNSLKDELSGILSDKIIAYDVEVKCVLFPALKFRNQPVDEIKSKNKVHYIVKKLGNVTNKNSFTMEYQCVSLEILFEMEGLNLEEIERFPF